MKRKGTGRAAGLFPAILTGLGTAGVVTLGGCALGAAMLNREVLAPDQLGLLSAGILIVAAGLGAWLAAKRAGNRRMTVCLLSAGCYLLLLMSCTALLFGGQYSGLGVTALIVMGTAAGIGILGLRQPGKGRRGGTGKMYKKALRKS